MRCHPAAQNSRNYKPLATLVLLSIVFSFYFYWNSMLTRLEPPPNFRVEEIEPIPMLKIPTKKTTIASGNRFYPVSRSLISPDSITSYLNKKENMNPREHADRYSAFYDTSFKKLPTPITRTSTCPPELELDRRYEEWYVKMFPAVSPFTLGQYAPANDTVVILTPVSNIADRIERYFRILCSLTYPKRLISVVLGEDSSRDDTYARTRTLVNKLKGYYPRVSLVRLSGEVEVANAGDERHAYSLQRQRRRHMADARNQLLKAGLRSEDWALWLDADLKHVPANLIEHMLSARKDVVAANSVYPRADTTFETYDKNVWRETNESLRQINALPEGELMLEGYGGTKRKYLNDLRGEGVVVRLDGVGGCALLVNASLHRRGLEFPNYAFHHHIETEGLAKMAAIKFNAQLYGLPFVTIIHP